MKQRTHIILALMLLTDGAAAQPPRERVPDGVWLRRGCELTVALAGQSKPRFMCFDPAGVLYVSFPEAGIVRACRDQDSDGHYEQVSVFVDEHPLVQGLCWHDGWLWFAESGAVFRGQDRDGDGRADAQETILPRGRLPTGGHWWRSVLIHEGRLYTSIGDSGNITDERETPRQKIWSYALDGSDERLFCSGIRNTEKLVVRPGSNEVWGMDHGSDWFGSVLEERAKAGQPVTNRYPPDEMNRYVEGAFYGHPFVVGHGVVRYEFMSQPDVVALAAKTVAPLWCTGAHWAPNAMTFYTGQQFPGANGSAFVAYHGSWNREDPAGYCVTLVLFEDGRPYGEQVYVNFLRQQQGQKPAVLGRPVDVVEASDGSLLISDDFGDRVYRLRYVARTN